MAILEVNNLCIDFVSGKNMLPVVSNVSFAVGAGKIHALVGESGCGKSISCLAVSRLLPEPPAKISADSITFESVDLTKLDKKGIRHYRGGKIAYIFQEPSVSLNPVFRVGDQIAEVIELHRPEIADVRGEIIDLLQKVGIPAPESRINAYPHELSGGMQQRIMIAMALAGNPRLLIADEPTTALDVTIQAQILELIDRLRKENNMAVILVTHNLGIVSQLADEVSVMYAGNIVEAGKADEVIRRPRHPYTAALLKAVPKLGGQNKRLAAIKGSVPSPDKFPAGCRFFGRCELCDTLSGEKQQRCATLVPPLIDIGEQHLCRCHEVSPCRND